MRSSCVFFLLFKSAAQGEIENILRKVSQRQYCRICSSRVTVAMQQLEGHLVSCMRFPGGFRRIWLFWLVAIWKSFIIAVCVLGLWCADEQN